MSTPQITVTTDTGTVSRSRIAEDALDLVFGNVVLSGMDFHVGEGKAGEIDCRDVKINLEGCTLGEVLAWLTAGESLRVKLQRIMRPMEPKAALTLKGIWETEGVNLRYVGKGRRGKGKATVDPAIVLAQMTPEARKALLEKYKV